jgi:hypothetical protein
MAVVRIDLEVNDKGGAQVLNTYGGKLKDVGAEGLKAGAAVGAGFAIASKALDAAIGLLQSVTSAISGAVSGFVALGGHLADVAAKTAISTQALQKLAFAGSLVGVSEEEITGAAVKMEKALANGDAVFGKLGLSIQKLRAMKPDEAFAAIAAQIMKIKDPAGQAAAAMEAFGKSGATLLPLMKSDIAAATAEAERLGIVLSDKDVAAADALGDEATKLSAAWEGVKNQFAASIVQNPAILAGLQSLVAAMGDLSQWLIKNRGAIAAIVDILIGEAMSAVEGFKQLTDWAGKAGSKLKYFVDMVPGLREALKLVQDLNTFLGMKNVEGSGLQSNAYVVGGPNDPNRKGTNFSGGKPPVGIDVAAMDRDMAAYKHSYEAMETEIAAFVHRTRMLELKEDEDFWKKEYKTAETTIDDMAKKYLDYFKLLDDTEKKNAEVFAEMERRKKEAMVSGIRAMADAFDSIGGSVASFAAGALRVFANIKEQGLKTASVWQKVAAAIQTAVSIYQNANTNQGESAAKGALSGAATGASMAGVPGAIIGALAGAYIGYESARVKYNKEMTELRLQFEKVEMKAKLLGITFDHTFDPRNPMQYKAAIDEINKAIDTQAEAQQKLADAVERYGFTIDEIGPMLAKQDLDKQMAQIYQDWQLLTAAGVDHEAMLTRIGPAVGTLVDQYKSAGVEIPSAMKPIIDDLYQHGKLLHENGEAYTEAEYNGLSYAQTMSQMFEDLIKKVDELVSALLGIPNVNRTVTVNTVHTGAGQGTGDPGDPGAGTGGEGSGGGSTPQERRDHGHASGLLLTSASRNGVARYHRGERVEITPAAETSGRRSLGGSGGGDSAPQIISIPVMIGGEKLDTIVMRRIKGQYIRVPA